MRPISPLAAYVFAAAAAALLVMVGVFVWSATNSEAEPMRTGTQIYYAVETFTSFFLLFWFLGLVWSAPFSYFASRMVRSHRLAPASSGRLQVRVQVSPACP